MGGSKKTTTTNQTVAPWGPAEPLIMGAAGNLGSAFQGVQPYLDQAGQSIQSMLPGAQQAYQSNPGPSLASNLMGQMGQNAASNQQLFAGTSGINPTYSYQAPDLSGLMGQMGTLGGQFAQDGRQQAATINGLTGNYIRANTGPQTDLAGQAMQIGGQSYQPNTGTLDALSGRALGMGDTFGQAGGQLANRVGGISANFDPSGTNASLAALSGQIGGIPRQYSYGTSGLDALGSQAQQLGQRAGQLPGQYQFGTGPVTADHSLLGSVAGAAGQIANRQVTPQNQQLQQLLGGALGLPGQHNLGATQNVTADRSPLDAVMGAAGSLAGQHNLGATRDVTANSQALQGALQTAQGLPSQYKFGADETGVNALGQQIAGFNGNISADNTRLDDLSKRVGSMNTGVSYDGPSDIIGGEDAQSYIKSVLGGNYLNSNPYIDQMAGVARQNAFNDISSAFGRSGMTGSSNFGQSLGQGISNAETGLRYGAYNDERGRMDNAAGLDYNFAGLRTNTAQNAAAGRMQAQGQTAQNLLQKAGLQSGLATTAAGYDLDAQKSSAANALQQFGLRGNLLDSQANRMLQGQQSAADLGLGSAQLGADIAGRIAANDLSAATGNADRALQGGTAQAQLGLGALGVMGDMAGRISGNDLAAATSNADRSLAGQRAQADLGLGAYGLGAGIGQDIAGNQLTAEQIMSQYGLGGLGVLSDVGRAGASNDLTAQQATAGNQLAGQRNAGDFALGAMGQQNDALGQWLASMGLGAQVTRDNAGTALSATGQQGDILRSIADSTLANQRAGVDTQLGIGGLLQQILSGAQSGQLGAMGQAINASGQSADLGARVANDNRQGALAGAGLAGDLLTSASGQQLSAAQGNQRLGVDAASLGLQQQGQTANQLLQLLQQQFRVPELQQQGQQISLGADQARTGQQLQQADLLRSILSSGTQDQIGLANASASLPNAGIPALGAMLELAQAGGQIPTQGATGYSQALANLLGNYTQQDGKQVTKTSGGLGSILGPLLSIGASFIPGVGPLVAAGAGAALGGAKKAY